MSISQDDLDQACIALYELWQQLSENGDLEDVKVLKGVCVGRFMIQRGHASNLHRQYGTKYLRIIKRLDIPTAEVACDTSQENDDEELDDEDDEILSPSIRSDEYAQVVYDVVHSPSYQVPILYLTVTHLSARSSRSGHSPSLDQVYDLLVPPSHRPQMEAVGVMGALSMTDHPITGLPAYFVHPCRTVEAMTAVLGGTSVDPEAYLLMWMGLVGGSVGLHVPVELAEAMNKSASLKDELGMLGRR